MPTIAHGVELKNDGPDCLLLAIGKRLFALSVRLIVVFILFIDRYTRIDIFLKFIRQAWLLGPYLNNFQAPLR